MAPEQVLGQPTDGRADLYALGCVALWLLSGKVLFKEETVMATVLAHVTKPPALSTLLPADVPPRLEQVLGQCLQKSPNDRPRDARALAASLRAITLPLEDTWTTERARAWWGAAAEPSTEP
jgi:serine/threonine-protein kinase